MKYILETAPGTDVFRMAAEEDGSPGCNFLLLRRKIGFLLKIEKEMVEYWTKDTKVFKEVQNMPARTKIIAAYPSLSPAERQAADFILSDPDAVPHLSIKQIAARAGVSMPTVTRLVGRATAVLRSCELRLPEVLPKTNRLHQAMMTASFSAN